MIGALSYIGFTSPRVDDWTTFGPEVLGLELAGRQSDGAVRLRCDDAVYRIAVHPGERDDLAYLGWEVASPAALEEAVSRLEAEGMEVHRGDETLTGVRPVADVAWFVDPFGFRHELSWGLVAGPSPFRPARALGGFVTGSAGVGHAVLIVPDVEPAERFFTDVLGLKLSDRIEAGITLRFFHCNSRHHSLAFVAIPGMVGFHHLMLEVASMDDVGTALDLCTAGNVPITMGMGRHTNDHMTSFYLRTPSGFDLEYGWGGLLVDDRDWVVRSYDSVSIWGHKPVDPIPPGVMRPFVGAGVRS